MADDQAQAPPKPSFVSTLIIVGLIIVIPAVAALAVYNFVLRPMFAPTAAVETVEGAYPESLTTVELPEARAGVLTNDPQEAAPILMFQLALACKNLETSELIQANLPYFQAKFLELHSNKARSELNDAFVRQTILRQAKEEANALLEKLRPNADLEVLEVMHLQFTIFDL